MSIDIIASKTREEIAGMTTRQKIGVGLATAATLVRVGAVYKLAQKPKSEAWSINDLAVASLIPISDFLDGQIARKMDAQTTGGAYADQMLDKASMTILEAKLASRGELPITDLLLRIGRDAYVTHVRSTVSTETNGDVSIAASSRGKNSTAARMMTDFMIMSPLGKNYPRTTKMLSHAATAMTIESGAYNVRQYTKASDEYIADEIAA